MRNVTLHYCALVDPNKQSPLESQPALPLINVVCHGDVLFCNVLRVGHHAPVSSFLFVMIVNELSCLRNRAQLDLQEISVTILK